MGDITTKEILEVVLAAAAVLVLIVLAVALIWSSFDRDKETAKSYMETLKKEIARADDGKVGDFDMVTTREGETRFFVVYFGEGIVVPWDGMGFRSVRENKNHICVCYLKNDAKKTECPVCEDLKYPASYGKEGSFIIYSADSVFTIKKGDGVYVFSK